MNYTSIIISIISSSVIATVFASIINIFIKKIEFKQAYYRIILDKRLKAYEWLENQIALLKTTVADDRDNKSYHIIFSYGINEYYDFTKNIMLANAYSLWINERTNVILNDLLHIFNQINLEIKGDKEEMLINLGKNYYFKISDLRNTLESTVRNDLLYLYKFSDIFNKKALKSIQYY